MENLREVLTEPRREAIRKAYEKLDPEQTSKVTIDDVAKNYCVDGARDVVKGDRTQEQHYQTFMGLWGLAGADD